MIWRHFQGLNYDRFDTELTVKKYLVITLIQKNI